MRGSLQVTARTATNVPIDITTHASQSVPAFRIRNSAGTSLFSLDVDGNLTVLGTTTTADTTVTDDFSVSDTLTVAGTATFSGNVVIGDHVTDSLTVNSASRFVNDAVFDHNLTVNNNMAVQGSLTVNGSEVGAIADASITVAKLANGTDGQLITWDAAGVAATVATGTAGHVLTSNGAGAAPTFQANAPGSGASTALDNLVAVAINTALLPDVAAADDFGSATLPFKDVFIAGSSLTPGTNNFRLTGASTSGTRVISFPDATGTLLYSGGALGTPSSGTLTSCSGLPVAGVTGDAVTALAVGSLELGHATDTTITRTGAGDIAVEGNAVYRAGGTDVPVADGGTGASTLTGLVLGNGASAMTAVTAPSGTVVGDTDTQTLTNKRVTPRVTSEASSATPTINTDNSDAHSITALATAITSMTTNLTGTPTNFQELIVRIKDDGSARAITWGASFEAAGTALPTTTVISKRLVVKFLYDTVTSKWGCIATAQEA